MKNALPSKFFDEVGDVPRAEYPRPQLQRDSYQTLNGKWKYAILPQNRAFQDWQGDILVPFAPESLLSGVQKVLQPDEVLYYGTEFEVDPSFFHEKTILHFDAVDYRCTVSLNEQELGTHTGGYLPFTFDVTGILKPGKNTLRVTVTDPTDTGDQARGKQSLAPGGIWYTSTSGIWGPVWMESVSEDYVAGLKIVPDIYSNTVTVTVQSTAEEVTVTMLDGETVKGEASGRGGEPIVLTINNYKLWSPAEPKLYDLVIRTPHDTVKSYVGMRKFTINRDRFGIQRLCLNDATLFHNGVLDQGYWSDGLMTAPTDSAMVYDLTMVKEMGFNMVRKHIKIEPLRYYYHCDRLGLIVWQDMVSGGHDYDPNVISVGPILGSRHMKDDKKHYAAFRRKNAAGREEFIRDVKGTVELLQNAVSVGMWVIFNEGWGQFDSDEIGEMVEKMDPTRTVDRTSGWHDQGHGSFISRHIYFTPIYVPFWDKRCYILSEFGGYSKKTPGHMQAKVPFGYRMYRTQDSLQKAWKKTVEQKIIKNIRLFLIGGMSGCVYTQLSDVEGEVNGLVTYDRKVEKFDRKFMKEVNDRVKYI